MTKRARAFLRGVGSLLDLSPDPRQLQDLIPRGTAEERLARHWQRVGHYLSGAMHEMDDEIAKQKRNRSSRPSADRGAVAVRSGSVRIVRSSGPLPLPADLQPADDVVNRRARINVVT